MQQNATGLSCYHTTAVGCATDCCTGGSKSRAHICTTAALVAYSCLGKTKANHKSRKSTGGSKAVAPKQLIITPRQHQTTAVASVQSKKKKSALGSPPPKKKLLVADVTHRDACLRYQQKCKQAVASALFSTATPTIATCVHKPHNQFLIPVYRSCQGPSQKIYIYVDANTERKPPKGPN